MRTCLIDIPGLTPRLIDALAGAAAPPWFDALYDEGFSVVEPVLPALTMTAQATFSTGKLPQEHGIIANGLPAWRLPGIHSHLDLSNYPEYRASVSHWEQSDKLLEAPRVWRTRPRTTALLFVQSSMGGAADVVVTPKPEHTPDGKTISKCWTAPADLYERLKEQLGPFPLHHYWGPMAGMKSTEWIAAASRLVWEWEPTDLHWVYIPQMDYDLQRWGPDDPRCVDALLGVLAQLTPLVDRVQGERGRVLIISEYGMTGVRHSGAPNAAFREAGLLEVNRTGEVDYERSKAFAMVDHQVAHVYCADESAADKAEQIIRGMEVTDKIYRGISREEVGLDSPRAGDIVAFSRLDAWYEYRWWNDWSQAPDYAWTVDIHRKPGYDPTELFADPATRRIRADQPQLVKGSHGAMPQDEKDFAVLIGLKDAPAKMKATEVAGVI